MKNILSQFISAVLLEGRMQDILKKYPAAAPKIKELSNAGVHPKYFEWAAKQLVKDSTIKMSDLTSSLLYLQNNVQSFTKKDIYAYTTTKQLEDEVKRVSAKKGAKVAHNEAVVKGANKLLEDDTYVVMNVSTKEASVCYGAGTKWCITMNDANYYEQYVDDGAVFYFVINKTLPPDNKFSKVAFALSIPRNKVNYEAFDAEDNSITLNDLPENYHNFFNICKRDLEQNKDIRISLTAKIKSGQLNAYQILQVIQEKGTSLTDDEASAILFVLDTPDDDSHHYSSDVVHIRAPADIKNEIALGLITDKRNIHIYTLVSLLSGPGFFKAFTICKDNKETQKRHLCITLAKYAYEMTFDEVKVLLSDKDETIRRNAMFSIFDSKSRMTHGVAKFVVENDPTEEHRARAVEFVSPSVAVRLLDDDNENIRINAYHALGENYFNTISEEMGEFILRKMKTPNELANILTTVNRQDDEEFIIRVFDKLMTQLSNFAEVDYTLLGEAGNNFGRIISSDALIKLYNKWIDYDKKISGFSQEQAYLIEMLKMSIDRNNENAPKRNK